MNTSESKRILIGYTGGYGGQFFSSLLHKAYVDDCYHVIPFHNKFNEYKYKQASDVFFKVETLLKMYAYHYLDFNHYDPGTELYKFFLEVKSDYVSLYDSNVEIFYNNLYDYIKSKIPKSKETLILSGHYCREHHGFSISNAIENVVFLLLTSTCDKHRFLFKLLFNIKKNNFTYPKFTDWYLNSRYFKDPADPRPFDSCIPIDAGKLFLDCESEYILRVEQILTETLNKKIILDKEVLLDYSQSNNELLDKFLNINSKTESLEAVIEAIERKLKSLL